MKSIVILASAVLTIFAYASQASANVITYHLVDVTFYDGAKATGSFDYDTSLATITAANIAFTGSSNILNSGTSNGYLPGSSNLPTKDLTFDTFEQIVNNPGGPVQVIIADQNYDSNPNVANTHIVMSAIGLTALGQLGTFPIWTSNPYSSYAYEVYDHYDFIASGSLSTVPEPSSITMLSLGLGTLGVLGFRKTRKAKSATV